VEKKFTEKIKNRWRNRGRKNSVIYAIARKRKKNKKFLKVAGGGPIPDGTVVDAVGNEARTF
jgi:hypothetical protein